MTWFKVDDSLHSHKKAMRAGVEAMGLWVLAGSWAADQLTDGWVPSYAALRIAGNAEELAARLVNAGLWISDTIDDEEGWRFHEWEEQQPTRDEVMARRKSDADRRARWREAKSASAGASRTGSRRDATRDNTRESALPDPTRPDPGSSNEEPHADSLRSSGTTVRTNGCRIPENFWPTPDMIEWARKTTPLVGQEETNQFKDWWESVTGAKATKRDWNKTWRVWMRKAQQDAERFQVSRRTTSRAVSNTDDNIAAFLGRTGTEDATILQLPRGRS